MVDSIDSYTGIAARWDDKCIGIICYILDKNGEPYTYAEISKGLGIATVEVSRILRAESYERRPYEWLVEKRMCNRAAYNYYLENHKILLNEETGAHELYVNFSKHDMFLNNCRLMNLSVEYAVINGRNLVFLFPYEDDERTTAAYATAKGSGEDFSSDGPTVTQE